MYQRYSQKQGWRFEILDANENGIGGYKEASAKITGKDVFAKLKFELQSLKVEYILLRQQLLCCQRLRRLIYILTQQI